MPEDRYFANKKIGSSYEFVGSAEFNFYIGQDSQD